MGECVDELKLLLKGVCTSLEKASNRDEGIKLLSERLGVDRGWLSEVLKVEKEAPKEVKEKLRAGQNTQPIFLLSLACYKHLWLDFMRAFIL